MVMPSHWHLAIAVILGLSFTPASTDDKICSVERHGRVRMFTGETLDVTLPCKYNLADVTCGDYRVKVTPGSAVDSDGSNLFSPSTLWVKVVNTQTDDYLEIRTSLRNMKKYKSGKRDNPWEKKDGSMSVVEFAGYDSSRGAAVLETSGVFSVEFSDAQHSVLVRCSSDHFSSPPLPDTLCGDATTENAMDSLTSTLFPESEDVSANTVVEYIVLNDDTVVQSKTCKDLATKLPLPAKPVTEMPGPAVTQPGVSETGVNETGSSTTEMPEPLCIASTEALLGALCGDDNGCSVPNFQCYDSMCVCAPGFFYSESKRCCMETCDEFSDTVGHTGFVFYRFATLECGPGVIDSKEFTGKYGMETCFTDCQTHDDCEAVTIDETATPKRCSLCRLDLQDPRVNLTLGTSVNKVYMRKCA